MDSPLQLKTPSNWVKQTNVLSPGDAACTLPAARRSDLCNGDGGAVERDMRTVQLVLSGVGMIVMAVGRGGGDIGS